MSEKLGPWFTARGMTNLEQVVDCIEQLERDRNALLLENESLRRTLREIAADGSVKEGEK